MSTFNYAKMATLADTLLTKFGQSMTLTAITEDGRYDPSTGASNITTTDSTVVGLILPTSQARVLGGPDALSNFDDSRVGNDLVDSKRRFCLLKAKNSTKPKQADKLTTADGQVYRVMGVTEINPAGTAIVYRLGLEAA